MFSQKYLQRFPDIIDGDVTLLAIIQSIEPLDSILNLCLGQTDGDVVLAGRCEPTL